MSLSSSSSIGRWKYVLAVFHDELNVYTFIGPVTYLLKERKRTCFKRTFVMGEKKEKTRDNIQFHQHVISTTIADVIIDGSDRLKVQRQVNFTFVCFFHLDLMPRSS